MYQKSRFRQLQNMLTIEPIEIMKKASMLGAAVLALTAGAALPAVAQGADFSQSRTTTVMNRPRPELDALGARAGAFIIMPSVGVRESYNDNIYANNSSVRHDFITAITPGVAVNSDWSSHSLQLHANSRIRRYASQTTENTEEYDVGADGRLDIRRDTNANATLRYQRLYEDRSSPDNANGKSPTEYSIGTAGTGFYNRWNRVALDTSLQMQRYAYHDVTTSTGTTVNNHDRNRNQYELKVRGSYDIQPQYAAFTEMILNAVDYNASVDDAGVNRDSSGYEVRAGARIDLTGLIFGDVFVGYLNRDYKDSTLKTINGMAGGANITWNVTPLTTLVGTVSRTISETTLTNSSGDLISTMQGRVDHELLRNLILSAQFGFSRDEFKGTSRKDDTLRGMVQARYMMNRNLYLTLRYDRTNKNSNVESSDYKQDIIFLQVRAQL